MSTKILYPDTAGLDAQDTPCQASEHSWLISPILAKSGNVKLNKYDLTINIWLLSYIAEDDAQAGLLGAVCGEGCHTCHICSDQVQGQERERGQDENQGQTNSSGVREFEVVGRYK